MSKLTRGHYTNPLSQASITPYFTERTREEKYSSMRRNATGTDFLSTALKWLGRYVAHDREEAQKLQEESRNLWN
jgi:hypothetical protein